MERYIKFSKQLYYGFKNAKLYIMNLHDILYIRY